ncbi:cell envelope integrity protein TolA [Methylophilaceae bacterium]|nr:cell envelope integrity protein TolA [Methylophilaceae bacterium]
MIFTKLLKSKEIIFTRVSKTRIFSKLHDNYELQANLFSFAIHFGLFIFMLVSIQWQMKDVYYSEIELWDAMPMQIKSQPAANKNKVPKPKKSISKTIEQQKLLKIKEDAEIKLKKKRKAEKRAKIKKIQKQALKQEKLEQLQKKLLEQEKLEQLQKKLLEQEKLEDIQKTLLEQEKLDKLKESILDQDVKKSTRIAIEGDQEVIAGSNTGELDKFKAMIQQKIYQNVNKQLCGSDLVELEFEIRLMPTGELLGEPKLIQSSKIESCDQALERAILQSQPLPVPKDAKLFSKLKNLKLKFSPNAYTE